MNAEFNIWLLVVGVVIGAGLVWLIVADVRRDESDVAEDEILPEARRIADAMLRAGRPVPADDVADVLRLHRSYLSGPPLEVEATVPIPADPPAAGSVAGAAAEPPMMAHPVITEAEVPAAAAPKPRLRAKAVPRPSPRSNIAPSKAPSTRPSTRPKPPRVTKPGDAIQPEPGEPGLDAGERPRDPDGERRRPPPRADDGPPDEVTHRTRRAPRTREG